MTDEFKYVTFNSKMGWIGILASSKGMLGTTLPCSSADEAQQMLGHNIYKAVYSPGLFDDMVGRLQAYFNGQKVVFDDEVDLSAATPFQREVWQMTRLIPYGETRSYRWVAEQVKKQKAARAVGQALGRNPLPIIVPCHRVVASNGGLAGFGGGIEMKRLLLSIEASTFNQ